LSGGISNASLTAAHGKMAALAAAESLGGDFSAARAHAYASLLGSWKTREDLPDIFWDDRATREREYLDAGADPELARAEPGVALEIMVDSGLTPGVHEDDRAVAFFTVGELSVSVASKHARDDAYKSLVFLEETLRTYVATKLASKFGRAWFKQRVDGNVAGKAKEIRERAVKDGEDRHELITYTELGELSQIISSKRNWEEVFGDIFRDRSEFDSDMRKVIAPGARRCTPDRSMDCALSSLPASSIVCSARSTMTALGKSVLRRTSSAQKPYRDADIRS